MFPALPGLSDHGDGTRNAQLLGIGSERISCSLHHHLSHAAWLSESPGNPSPHQMTLDSKGRWMGMGQLHPAKWWFLQPHQQHSAAPMAAWPASHHLGTMSSNHHHPGAGHGCPAALWQPVTHRLQCGHTCSAGPWPPAGHGTCSTNTQMPIKHHAMANNTTALIIAMPSMASSTDPDMGWCQPRCFTSNIRHLPNPMG